MSTHNSEWLLVIGVGLSEPYSSEDYAESCIGWMDGEALELFDVTTIHDAYCVCASNVSFRTVNVLSEPARELTNEGSGYYYVTERFKS